MLEKNVAIEPYRETSIVPVPPLPPYSVLEIDGREYHLVPAASTHSAYDNGLKNYLLMIGGILTLGGCLLIGVSLGGSKQPPLPIAPAQPVQPAPIIVQPAPPPAVNPNCSFFCGK